MQDNGIPAAAFVPLLDVPPDLAAGVLDVLRAAGVGAVARPLAADPTQALAPRRSLVRIFADSAQVARAQVVVRAAFPGPDAVVGSPEPAAAERRPDGRIDVSQEHVDATWSAMVADLGDLRPADDEAEERPATGSGLSQRLVRRHPAQQPEAAVEDDDDDDDFLPDEHFVPPTPPPLPRPSDAVGRFAWAAVIGGPVILVGSHVVGLDSWWGGLGIAAFAAGFVTLVARMRDERDDDGPGAVV